MTLAGCGDDSGQGNNQNENQNNGNGNTASTCGDGVTSGVEECDNGAANSDSTPDACRTSCELAHCGDGVVDTGETCDDGPANSDDVPDACRLGCTPPSCGDGVVDVQSGETCDDGNTTDGDGCSSECLVEFCGNGHVDDGELCDDGNLVPGDGCSPDCQSDETCGNGIIDPLSPAGPEECDQGTANSWDPDAFCRPDCRIRSCGDGVLDPVARELCEPGLAITGTTCVDLGFYDSTGVLACTTGCDWDTSGCTGFCGDHVKNGLEACDDADLGGLACPDVGFHTGTLSCTPLCSLDRSGCSLFCGDGERNGPELCDGAPPPGEGCTDYGYDFGALSCTGLCTPDFPSCSFLGWRRQMPPAIGNLNAVWAADADHVWIAGTDDLLYWDGSTLAVTGQGVLGNATLISVHGSRADHVMTVGYSGAVFLWNGTSWSDISIATGSPMLDVWVSPFSDTFAVAVGGGGDLAHHWNGTSWSAVPTTLNPNFTRNAVWGSAENDIWTSGYGGTMAHWNGTSWSEVSLPVGHSFVWDIWGAADNAVWAVGDGGMLHYNGSSWTEVTLPTGWGLNAIWGASRHEIWAAGGGGTLLYYDGLTWREVESGTNARFNGIGGAHGADIWAVGETGTIRRYSGVHWLVQDLPSNIYQLRALWGATFRGVYAASRTNDPAQYDGSNWLAWPYSGATTHNGIWGLHSSDILLAGDSGGILQWNGTWNTQTSNTTAHLRGVHGRSATDRVVVGEAGTIRHYVGGTWTTRASGTTRDLNAVWMAPDGQFWAVGAEGRIKHWDGATLHNRNYTQTWDLLGVWGTDNDNVFAVGATGGVILHWNGSQWTEMDAGSLFDLYDIWGASGRDIFAVGSSSTVVHFDGEHWARVDVNLGSILRAIWGHPGEAIFFAQSYGGEAGRLEYPFGNMLACPPGKTPVCGPADVKIAEVSGGTPDYIELVNTGCCAQDIGGFRISYWLDNDTSVTNYAIPAGIVLQPGQRFRLLDSASNLGFFERYVGKNIGDNPNGEGWVALCSGICDTTGCTNFLDYFEKTGGSPAQSAPACASMEPGPLDVSMGTTALVPQRRAFLGGGTTGRLTDWTLGAPTRE